LRYSIKNAAERVSRQIYENVISGRGSGKRRDGEAGMEDGRWRMEGGGWMVEGGESRGEIPERLRRMKPGALFAENDLPPVTNGWLTASGRVPMR
jgi:hypothetical protein